MQEYLVVSDLVSADGKQRWRPGSKIELDDERAAIHLRNGNVRPLDHTVAPAEPVADVVVHEPAAPNGHPASGASAKAPSGVSSATEAKKGKGE